MKNLTQSIGRSLPTLLLLFSASQAPTVYAAPAVPAQVAALPAPSAAPQAPQAPEASAGEVDITSTSYLLSPDDTLIISVQGHDDFQRTVTILQDGTFDYYAKKYHAAGMTVDELAQSITIGLKRQIRRPYVTVSVQATHPKKITIIGNVKAQGQYDYKPGMRLLTAIGLCGGLAQTPEETQVTLVTDNGQVSHPVDVVGLMSTNSDPALNVEVHPGDIINVAQRPLEESQIRVTGEVAKSGEYPVPATGATVMTLITMAGGATPAAALSRVEIVHDGQLSTVDLHPTLYNVDTTAAGTKVFPGDYVHVPLNNDKYYLIGDVAKEGISVIPDGEKWTVTMALTAAGGATDAGDKKAVEVARLGPDGKMVPIIVNVDDLYKANNKATDVVLQRGDIVYVPRRHQKRSIVDQFSSAAGTVFNFATLRAVLGAGL